MRVAAIQTTAGPDLRDNLQTAADLVRDAADLGSQLVVLPELFSVAGTPEHIHRHAEDINGSTMAWAAELAAHLRIHLVAGSFPERGSDDRVYNTSCLLGPTGSLEAVYRKVHLFDVHIGDTEVHESGTFAAGDSVAVAPIAAPADGQPAVVEGSGTRPVRTRSSGSASVMTFASPSSSASSSCAARPSWPSPPPSRRPPAPPTGSSWCGRGPSTIRSS